VERDGTAEFRLDPATVEDVLRSGRERAASTEGSALLDRARDATSVSLEDVAALWLADVDGASLYAVALERRRRRPAPLETFSPLYLTNTCDAECRMCGMRRDNAALQRETASEDEVDEQLRTLQRRGMNAVALLTGEYRRERRSWAIARVNRALRSTESLGFGHVLINVGSLDDDEMEILLDGIPRHEDGSVVPKLTRCTFQETYSRPHYARFMGRADENPRAHYDRRLANFDRAHAAGIRVANPGILVGLNPDLGFELIALVLHSRHLLAAGMEVYLSVPRLRQIAGGKQRSDGRGVRPARVAAVDRGPGGKDRADDARAAGDPARARADRDGALGGLGFGRSLYGDRGPLPARDEPVRGDRSASVRGDPRGAPPALGRDRELPRSRGELTETRTLRA